MNKTQSSVVMSWLEKIEAYTDEITEIMYRCATNNEALQYFLIRARDG